MIPNSEMLPTVHDAEIAKNSSLLLSRYAERQSSLRLQIVDEDEKKSLELPAGAVMLLSDILSAMARGQSVTLIPENKELSTVQAADILNVSRPYLIKLLEEGSIPYHKVGSHRRVQSQDVLAYKKAIDTETEKILDTLVEEAQSQGDYEVIFDD